MLSRLTSVVMWRLRFCVCLMFLNPVNGHIPEQAPTPANKIDQFCALAESCVHDTIPICGKMGETTRTFLDLCDLLEFACDTTNVFSHVDDEPGCPQIARPAE